MQGLPESLAVLLGFVLRIGLPLLLTGLAVWGLKKLDERWQAEASDGGLLPVGEPTVFHQLQCWIRKDCPEERMQSCPAYLESKRPCWQMYRDVLGNMKNECLDCEVYTSSPVHVPA